MTRDVEDHPRPAEQLRELADYYDTHDTAATMSDGEWVESAPMVTTSLRLPADVIAALKREATSRHVRYTALVRSILAEAAGRGQYAALARIDERLERIERAVTGPRGGRKARGD